MEESVKIGEAGAVLSQRRQILILDRELVINILEHDYEHPVKVASRGLGSGFGCGLLFSLGRFTNLRQVLLILNRLFSRL